MKTIRLSFATLVSCAFLAALAPPVQAQSDVADPTGAVLDQVNGLRDRHFAPPLAPDAGLAQGAQAWADRGVFERSSPAERGGAAETLFYQRSRDPLPCDERVLSRAVDAWYDEIRWYDFRTHSGRLPTGDFTQLVWKSTERVGMGIAATPQKDGLYGCMVVGRFDPPGNYVGQFDENVLPPRA